MTSHICVCGLVCLAITACSTDEQPIDIPPEYWCVPDACTECPACPACAKPADACDDEGIVTAALDGTCWREYCLKGEQTLVMHPNGTACVFKDTGGYFVPGQCINGGCK